MKDPVGGPVPGNRSSANTIQDTFERIETKFIVPQAFKNHFLRELRDQPGWAAEEREGAIESIYFDSGDLVFLRQALARADGQSKLRIRAYPGSNPEYPCNQFIEIKSKSNSICYKVRMAISKHHYERLLRGQNIVCDSELRKLNSNMSHEKFLKHFSMISELWKTVLPLPRISTCYQRRSLEGDGLRITLDTGLKGVLLKPFDQNRVGQMISSEGKAHLESLVDRFDVRTDAIVEVKSKGPMPDWLQEIMSRLRIVPTRFSKYCWGIGQIMAQPRSNRNLQVQESGVAL